MWLLDPGWPDLQFSKEHMVVLQFRGSAVGDCHWLRRQARSAARPQGAVSLSSKIHKPFNTIEHVMRDHCIQSCLCCHSPVLGLLQALYTELFSTR